MNDSLNSTQNTSRRGKKMNVRRITIIGMLGAAAALLMLFEFPVPFVPPFIKMDFSELPIILGSFMLGAGAGIWIAVLKILIHTLLHGTTTMWVGETANLIGSVAYILPAVLMYRRHCSKCGAAESLLFATVVVSAVVTLCNYFFIFPAFMSLFGLKASTIVAMGSAGNPHVGSMVTLMLYSVFPFNLFKYGTVSAIAFFTYKRLKRVLLRGTGDTL